jgi:hypothetical protein
MYSQSNCYINAAIETLANECGCVGKFIGNTNASNDLEECRSVGNIDWMENPTYEQCQNKSTDFVK